MGGFGTPGSSQERHFVSVYLSVRVPIHPVSLDPPRLTVSNYNFFSLQSLSGASENHSRPGIRVAHSAQISDSGDDCFVIEFGCATLWEGTVSNARSDSHRKP